MSQTIVSSAHHVHVDGHSTCPCGQELDAWRRAHCPRCGHRLTVTRRQFA